LPGGGSFQLSGIAGPVDEKDTAKTPFQAALQLKHFDPVAAGAVESGQGISMVADFNAQLASDGTNLMSTGKIVASKLQLSRSGSPAPKPVDLDYSISSNMDTRIGKVSNISIHTGTVTAHVSGGFRSTEKDTVLDLHLSALNQPIDQLEQLLPAAGVNLPTGSKLHGGTLTANLNITGTVNATEISGSAEIDNTELAGFDLGSKIEGINPFKSKNGGTEIEKLSTELKSTPQSTQLNNIYGSVPKIGTATGSGSVSSSGALDFTLVAKLKDSSVVGALANEGTRVMRFIGSGAESVANNGIPLTISGTTSNPSFRVNAGAMLKGQASGQPENSSGQQKTNLISTLKGLFHK